MTREEIADLLEIIVAAYPNAKLGDAKRMLDAWQMAFGEDDASEIYMAARLHMKTCQFFPTISDIENKKFKGKLIYADITPINPRIDSPDASPAKLIGDCKEYQDFLDDIFGDLGLNTEE